MPGARLKDIANSLGCSIGVVSHVLNHSEGNISCSDALRDRIHRKAVELGYLGNWTSRTLRVKRTNTLGVFVPPASSAFFRSAYEGQLLAGVSEVCRECGYDLLLISIPGSAGAEECATKLASRRVDGLVLLHVPESADWLQPLVDLKANCAAVNYFGSVLIPSVNFDDRAATFLAVSEMVRMGHRRLGYVGALRIDAGYSTQRRLDGFLGGLAESHLRPDPHWIFEARYSGGPSPDWRRLSPRDLAQWFAARFVATRQELRPTAFVCHSDAVAALLLTEFHRMGVRCPEDVSLVGLDDAPISRSLFPSLSTIRQPLSDMGARAARYVLDAFEKLLSGSSATPPGIASQPPLETAARVRGRRGRPSSALQTVLAQEANARTEAASEQAPPVRQARRKLFLYTKPEFILRDSTVPPHHA
ncbi:MAG: LacI family DNA-binding transcriptional regulator [Kiritimatiellia bacterium]